MGFFFLGLLRQRSSSQSASMNFLFKLTTVINRSPLITLQIFIIYFITLLLIISHDDEVLLVFLGFVHPTLLACHPREEEKEEKSKKKREAAGRKV